MVNHISKETHKVFMFALAQNLLKRLHVSCPLDALVDDLYLKHSRRFNISCCKLGPTYLPVILFLSVYPKVSTETFIVQNRVLTFYVLFPSSPSLKTLDVLPMCFCPWTRNQILKYLEDFSISCCSSSRI
jgi:hypothetical protein